MSPRPSILHIARNPQTGVWSVIRQLCKWQRDRGARVGVGLLLSSTWTATYWEQLADLEKSGIKVMTEWSPNIFGTGAFLYHRVLNPVNRWSRTYGGGKPLIVHFHNAWLSGAYLPIRAEKVTAAVTYHGIQGERALDIQPVRRLLHRSWAQRLVRHSVRHATVDSHNTRVAERLFGINPSLFTVIPNGTARSPNGGSYCPRSISSLRPTAIGHVGIVDEGKGWRITAEAVRELFEDGHNVRFVLAGSGPHSAEAAAWCTKNAKFATNLGYVKNPQADVFPTLDVMVLPSLSEGLPMAVLEALSFSIPVIATAVGGLPEVIQDGRNGFLIERTVHDAKDALRRILADPTLYEELSRGAGETFNSRYSVDVMGAAYDDFYST